MQAIRVHTPGDVDAMQLDEKVDIPDVKDNEILVKIEATGINFIDTYHRSGMYPLPTPFILGREGAGIVTKVGKDVTEFKVGSHVGFMCQGTYAQYAAVAAHNAVTIPDGVDSKTAAAALLQGATAHYLTHSTYPVKQGDWVLVHAAAGGTGGLVVEMAKMRGARVIGTVGSSEKIEIAKQLGADHVINYKTEDFEQEVKRITEGKGVNVVYDGVGAATYEKSFKCMAKLGYVVMFGNASGPVPPINPLDLTKLGSLFMTRPSLFDYIAKREDFVWRLSDVFKWIQEKKIHIRVAKELPLSEAREAHRLLTSRDIAGKILLLPQH